MPNDGFILPLIETRMFPSKIRIVLRRHGIRSFNLIYRQPFTQPFTQPCQSRVLFRNRSVMGIPDGPPSSQKLTVRRCGAFLSCVSTYGPWFVGTDEVGHRDAGAVVVIRWGVLIMPRRCDVINERESIPISKVLVQQTLISAIERYPPVCKIEQAVVRPRIRFEHHDTAIETIRPPDIRRRRKPLLGLEQFLGRPQSNHISIDIHNLFKLRHPP